MVKGSLPLQPATSPPVIRASASLLRCRGLVFALGDFDIPGSWSFACLKNADRVVTRTSTRPARHLVEHRAAGAARRYPRRGGIGPGSDLGPGRGQRVVAVLGLRESIDRDDVQPGAGWNICSDPGLELAAAVGVVVAHHEIAARQLQRQDGVEVGARARRGLERSAGVARAGSPPVRVLGAAAVKPAWPCMGALTARAQPPAYARRRSRSARAVDRRDR